MIEFETRFYITNLNKFVDFIFLPTFETGCQIFLSKELGKVLYWFDSWELDGYEIYFAIDIQDRISYLNPRGLFLMYDVEFAILDGDKMTFFDADWIKEKVLKEEIDDELLTSYIVLEYFRKQVKTKKGGQEWENWF